MAPNDILGGQGQISTANGYSYASIKTTTNGHSNGITGANGANGKHISAPALSSILKVERGEKAFSSRAVSLISLPAGSIFTPITTAAPTSTKAYSSVQISEDAHIELNSDLLFCNHSCSPSLVFDMSKFEVRVVSDRDLNEGDALTFFYPSSEWEMAQHFDCTCGSEECKGRISGAEDMDESVLRGYWLNLHIERMLDARNAAKVANGNGVANGKH